MGWQLFTLACALVKCLMPPMPFPGHWGHLLLGFSGFFRRSQKGLPFVGELFLLDLFQKGVEGLSQDGAWGVA